MVLAKRYGINQKTVAKWKRRTGVKDRPTGPEDAHSTVLSVEDEATGLSVILCARPVVFDQPWNRSPKTTANWTLASNHSRGGRFHSSAA